MEQLIYTKGGFQIMKKVLLAALVIVLSFAGSSFGAD